MLYLNQLQAILKATAWSQEQLARQLNVSFPALNAWLNERAVPRRSAQERIVSLYMSVVGAETVNPQELITAKQTAAKMTYSVKKLLKDKPALDTLTLHWTYNTNTIEGSTMTLADVEDVIFDNKVLANRTLIEQAEARNHQAAFYWLLDKVALEGKDFVLTEQLILELHIRLMNGILGNAGQYRNHSVRLAGMHVPLANWRRIPELIQQLLADSQQEKPATDIVTSMAYFHARFEQIHPFSDGNGRTGRLLLLAQALASGYVPPLVLRERKQAYYKYLEKAQTQEDYTPLELFIAQAMEACYKLLTAKSA